jgi:hypothetical protein
LNSINTIFVFFSLEIIFISSSVESYVYDTLETDPDSDDADSTTVAHDSSSGNDDESISTIELPIPAIFSTDTVERLLILM